MADAGGKGSNGYSCFKCLKVLSSKDALKQHGLRKHQWDFSTNKPATAEVIGKQKSKDEARKKKRSSTSPPADPPARTHEDDLIGDISDSDEPSSDQEDIEITGLEVPLEKASTTLSAAERVAEKTSWTLAATSPTDPQYQPCERRKTLPVKPPNPKSDSRMRSLTAEPIAKQGRMLNIRIVPLNVEL